MGNHEPDRERIMSDTAATDSNATEPVATDAAATPEPSTADKAPEKDWQAEAEKWKAFARKHEDTAKANADKAKRFEEFEESQKSETQKAVDRAAAAEARIAEIEARALRAEVAAAKGIPANLLSGSTQEELEASADALIAFRGEKPKPDFGAGDRGSDVGAGKALTEADLKDMTPTQINEARRAGRLDNLLRR
jgi:hypothetical protein